MYYGNVTAFLYFAFSVRIAESLFKGPNWLNELPIEYAALYIILPLSLFDTTSHRPLWWERPARELKFQAVGGKDAVLSNWPILGTPYLECSS